MPFDPLWPQNGQLADGDKFREQFTALKTLIDAGGGVIDAQVDAVITTDPATPASVTVSVVNGVLHLTFSIPQGMQGQPGMPGTDGTNGTDGSPGIQGPPGEITQAQLDAAISGTSKNSNTVATLDTPFADPDAESVRLRFNELVLTLRR